MKQLRCWLLLAGALTAVSLASAQSNWPVHRGSDLRWGEPLDNNGVPVLTDDIGPGRPLWWWPLQKNTPQGTIIDIDQLPSNNRNVTQVGVWTNPTSDQMAAGYLGNGYSYHTCVASTDIDNPDAGATASVTWTFQPDTSGIYALYIQIPSAGTHLPNGNVIPNASRAIFRVTWGYGGNRQSRVFVEYNSNGGSWQQIARKCVFTAGPSAAEVLTVTLLNTVPLQLDDNGMPEPIDPNPSNVIVCADGMKLAAAPVTAQSAPVVIHLNGEDDIIVSRNISVQDPSDTAGATSTSVGQVVCLHPQRATDDPGPVWTWTPSLQANVNVIGEADPSLATANPRFIAPQPGFQAVTGVDLPADAYDGKCYAKQSQGQQNLESTCRFEFVPPASGTYDIYVWIPASGVNGRNNTNDATYIFDYYNGTGSVQERVSGVDQEKYAGTWHKINTHPIPFDPQNMKNLTVEVSDYSANPGTGVRYTVVSGIMFVTGYSGTISVTPGVYTVNVKPDSGSAPVPKQVVFVADESGYLYMLDAVGDGKGGTWAYWSYPSIPNANDANWKDPNADLDKNQPKPLGYLQTSVVVDPALNAVFVGAVAGGVLSIDCAGRGDFNLTKGITGTTTRRWTYTDKNADGRELLQVASHPAYHNGTLYVASTQSRVYALDGAGKGDRTTTVRWIWPNRAQNPGDAEDPPAKSVQGTIAYVPTSAGDLIVFGTWNSYATLSNKLTSRVIALNAAGIGGYHTSVAWQYPDPGDTSGITLGSMGYGGPLFVPKADGVNDLIWVATQDGYMYSFSTAGAIQPTVTGFLGGGVTSPPTWVNVSDPINGGVSKPCAVVGTSDASLVAMSALDLSKGVWAQQINDGSQMFASAAEASGVMYAYTTSGQVIAFNASGYDVNHPFDTAGYAPVTTVQTPDQGGTNLANATIYRVDRATYMTLQNATSQTQIDWTKVVKSSNKDRELEWGAMVYLVVGLFKADSGNVSFQVRGPSSSQRFPVPIKALTYTVGNDSYDAVGLYAFLVKGTPSLPCTPGEQYSFDAFIQPNNQGTFGPVPHTTLDSPTIRNPLAINAATGGVAWPANLMAEPQGSDPQYISNGDGGVADPIQPQGQGPTSTLIGDGQHGSGTFYVADRSILYYTTGSALDAVAMLRDDLLFGGGKAAMVKPLPWDVPPVGFPNPSPDYPDIDRRLETVTGINGNTTTNLLTGSFRLNPPINGTIDKNYKDRVMVPTPINMGTDVPMFQPANLAGYNGKLWVFVDTNPNNKLDGVTTSISKDIVTLGAEAYRTLGTTFTVPPRESLAIVQSTIDLGQVATGRGFTPQSPRNNQNQFYPGTDGITPGWLNSGGLPKQLWDEFQAFTVLSYGNVNMLNLRAASQVLGVGGAAGFLQPVGFFASGLSSQSWLGADQTLVTNLDPRFGNRFGTSLTGNSITLHKPRPGDRSPTQLNLPDSPYGAAPGPFQPELSVAVPIGQPVGRYSARVSVFEDLFDSKPDMALEFDANNSNHWLETVADPSPIVTFTVTETRLTNDFDPGGLPQYDAPPGPNNNFRVANASPTAFRNQGNGDLYMAFMSQRPDATTTTSGSTKTTNPPWSIYTGILKQGGQPPQGSVLPPLSDLFGWAAGKSGSNAQWWIVGGPYADPSKAFSDTPGTVEAGSAQFYDPAFPVNMSQVKQSPYLFWQGQVVKTIQEAGGPRQVLEYGTFYGSVNSSGAVTSVNRMKYDDPYMPRFGVKVILAATGKGAKMFWYAGSTGRYSIFVAETDDISNANGWSVPEQVYVPKALSSMQDPCPVWLDNRSIDLVFSGVTKDRKTNEIFKMSFVNRGGYNWGRPVPIAVPPAATFDSRTGNVWRSSTGLDFAVNNIGLGIDVQIANPSSAAVETANVAGTQVRDTGTGMIRWQSTHGGYLLIDPSAGTVTFPTMPPATGNAVGLIGAARVARITPLSNVGGSTEPSSFYDIQPLGDLRYTFNPGGSAVAPNARVPADRYWNFYKVGATLKGQATTIYFQPMRVGVQLSNGIDLRSPVAVSGSSSYYTIDPQYSVGQNGAVYFTTVDLGRTMTVTYTDATGKGQTQKLTAAWIAERPAAAIPVKAGPIAEGQVCAFQDPWVMNGGRPDMAWLFWSSSRSGASDIYFETLTPQFYPVVGGQ